MIRHIGVIRFHEGTTEADIEALIEAFMAFEIEGMVARDAHRGLDLRPGDADCVFVADFEDEQAFRRFDTDKAHSNLRAGLAGRIIESSSACQYLI